ncbi:MAG: saccharopine dehydrogenase-like oxidoreductase [Cyanobacteria bacterium]|nr:saccharopine dehydrogenase-like oxidoreductase [Cyanobacteriota bacterium]
MPTTQQNQPIRVAILGAGGLGKGMAEFIPHRPDFQLVAIADRSGFAFNAAGLDVQQISQLTQVIEYPGAVASDEAILELLQAEGENIDAIFKALPNIPVGFCAQTIEAIVEKTSFRGVIVDALKRTRAVEQLLPLSGQLKEKGILYITGAGATPGFLTTAAAVAAQSFIEVLSVNIYFGVGISNWEAYKATIREDLLHLEGFNAEKVAKMTDAEIQAELDARDGLLELTQMEHADDVILELAGICSRDRVTVGGLVDTRNAKKPVSTTVTVTGRTLGGAVGSHQFVVSDETTMVDNVCGPALGFMLRGVELYRQGKYGVITSADIMPRYQIQVRQSAASNPLTQKIPTLV